jgi:hypothetical protein
MRMDSSMSLLVLLRPLSLPLREYIFVPLLERAPTEGGGEGPPATLLGAEGKPFMLIFSLEPPELGGDMRFGRLFR